MISEFDVDADQVVVDTPATLTVTVENVGSGDARPFDVLIAEALGDPPAIIEFVAVEDGLAAGASTTLTTSLSAVETGPLGLKATVDPSDRVDETTDLDNERILEIIVQGLGNVTVPGDGFTVSSPDADGVSLFYFTLVNTGANKLVTPLDVKFFAYTDAGDYVEWGSHDLDLDLEPNEPQQTVVAYNVEPGTYRAYVLADPDNVLEETNEDDNQAYFDFTAP